MRLLSLKSVLVATDLGEGAHFALRTAARLASLAEARLHVLHVAEREDAPVMSRLRQALLHAAPGAPEPASVRVLAGSPGELIVERAGQTDADVVILGPHRARGSAPLGSTAMAVVHAAPCPCLVAATPLRLPLERVVVPIDISANAEIALSVALSWASALRRRGHEAQLTALHVVRSLEDGVERSVHAEVERAREAAGDVAYVSIREQIVTASNPAEEILRQATSAAADLLVLGTRGAGHATADLGSVSSAVTRTTRCPLLLVPADSAV